MRLLPTVSIVLLTGSVLALVRYTTYYEEESDSRSRTRSKRSLRSNNVTDGGGGRGGDNTRLSDDESIPQHNHSSQNRFRRSLFSLDEEDRPPPQWRTRRLLWGDSGKCSSGSCEFFLFCWLSGGLVEKGCGGFLFACCRHNVASQVKSGIGYSPTEPPDVPEYYGPVMNDPRCGLAADNLGAQERIVGGREAGFGSFPWQAYIRVGSSRCGGSLINERHVITAGHCVARAQPHQIAVTLGDYVLNSNSEPYPPVTVGVSSIKVHPHFKFTPQADRYDVAVIKLDRKVNYLPHIRPICLPDRGSEFRGQYGWVTGWGALEPGSRLRPKTLQAVDVPVLESRACEVWHKDKGINVIIYDEMMCAGYQFGGKDSCQGDSGGPLTIQQNGRWYLIGIVSAGYSCAQRQQPGIYHRVAYTADWISHAANS
ncbi:prostasin isoform X2 [Folsomia candida]|nr:prostasin isoform X2 [Folsomia candida]